MKQKQPKSEANCKYTNKKRVKFKVTTVSKWRDYKSHVRLRKITHNSEINKKRKEKTNNQTQTRLSKAIPIMYFKVKGKQIFKV